jgi:hypothetical protein
MLVKPAVLAFIRQNQPVHMNQIVNALSWMAGEDAVESAVYQLASEGKISSTLQGYVVG